MVNLKLTRPSSVSASAMWSLKLLYSFHYLHPLPLKILSPSPFYLSIQKISVPSLLQTHLKEDKEKLDKLKDDKFNQLLQTHKGQKFNFGNDYGQYIEEIYRKYEN